MTDKTDMSNKPLFLAGLEWGEEIWADLTCDDFGYDDDDISNLLKIKKSASSAVEGLIYSAMRIAQKKFAESTLAWEWNVSGGFSLSDMQTEKWKSEMKKSYFGYPDPCDLYDPIEADEKLSEELANALKAVVSD